MDEHVEALKRALREDPSDLSAALRLAAALEKTGRFDEAWELLEKYDHGRALADLAVRNVACVLARLRKLDYHHARLMIDRLIAIRLHSFAAYLACQDRDDGLRRCALKALSTIEDASLSPSQMAEFLALEPREDEPSDKRERLRGMGRSLAQRVIARAGTAHAVALLPWLIPLLTCRDPQLAAQALEIVRRLTDRDGPPFDADLLARLLERNEGEAA
jgi:hypothetical protein